MRQTDITFEEMLSDISKEWHAPLQPLPDRDALIDERARLAAAKREAALQRVRRARERRAAGRMCLKDVEVDETLTDVLIESQFLPARDADDPAKVCAAVGRLLDKLRVVDVDAGLLRATTSDEESA